MNNQQGKIPESTVNAIGTPLQRQSMGAYLHKTSPSSPRGAIARSIAEQSSAGTPYESDAGKMLLQRRYGTDAESRFINRGGSTPGPVGFRGKGTAYVPSDINWTTNTQPYESLGRETIQNHELEHAINQGPSLGRDWKQAEYGPAIGDLIFSAERFQAMNGKPLNHSVQFESGTPHDIQWMQSQAKKHGYWDGRSMTDLLFNTDAGRAWLKSKMQRPGPTPSGKQSPAYAEIPGPRDFQTNAANAGMPAAPSNPPIPSAPAAIAARAAFSEGLPSIQSFEPMAEQPEAPVLSEPTQVERATTMNNSAVPTSRMTMAPKRNAAAARSAFVTGPDIDQNNANIAAMASQVDGMQARMNQPQHLRFADLGNRAMVNSGLGGQMDGGNLPSSQNQLAFANRQEQRGQRADAQMASVMNPTFHNGIKVNPAAVARNLSMSAGDKQNLTANGWEVSPGGVIQRAPRKQTGGGTFGAPNPAMSASTEAQPMNQASIAAGRARYGLPEDGSGRQLSGRAAAIMARTDISPEEKQQFIEKANALDFMKGRKTMADLDLSSQMEAIGALKERSDRIVAKKTREGYFNNIRQQQAQAQQQAMMGQVAQAAMMGNPQAMQMMETMQRGNQNAAQIAMEQARLMQDGQYKQGLLGLQQQENTLAGERNNLIATTAAEQARRDDAMREATQKHNATMAELQAQMNLANQSLLSARNQREADVAKAEMSKIQTEAEQSQYDLERQRTLDTRMDESLGQMTGREYPEKVENYAQRIAESGADPATARMQAKALASQESLASLASRDPRAAKILDMPPSSLEMESATPVQRVDDFFSRMNQSLNMFPATYGSGTKLDGSGGVPGNRDLLVHAMNMEGITESMFREFISGADEGFLGRTFGSAGNQVASEMERQAKKNIARFILGQPIVPFNEKEFIQSRIAGF